MVISESVVKLGPGPSPLPQEEAQSHGSRNAAVTRTPEASMLILPERKLSTFLPLEFSGPQLMGLILPNTMTFPDSQTLLWSVLMNENSL